MRVVGTTSYNVCGYTFLKLFFVLKKNKGKKKKTKNKCIMFSFNSVF